MQIAILTNPITVGDYHELFPNTSFSANGPSNEFLAENNAKKVTLFKAYDKLTQKLVSCEPYDDGEFVSLVKVESLPDEEIASARNASMAGIRALVILQRRAVFVTAVKGAAGGTKPPV